MKNLDLRNEETNSNLEPIAIGGGTYARAFDNCISFGANFPGNKDMCHQTDEFLDIDTKTGSDIFNNMIEYII